MTATTDAPLLSVVIPTRNEAANVEPLWAALQEALSGIEHEVCFIDDSDDDTPDRLAALGAAGFPVRVVHRQGVARAGGLATAVVEGMRVATGRYVCVMDADLQHPPAEIPLLLEAAQAGADVAVASRYVRGGSRGGLSGRGRRLVSRCSTLLARLLFTEARRSTDPLAGFFLCRRELIDGIEFRPVGFKILLELLVCVPNLRVTDVPLEFAARAGGESKASVEQGALFLRHLASLFFNVEGSARLWKFGAVGLTGTAVFIGLLSFLTGTWRIDAAVAFWPAFIPAVIWNTLLNRAWTYADLRRRAMSRRLWIDYPLRAIVAGVVAFLVYALVLREGVSVQLAGLVAALVAMAVNAVSNRRSMRRPAAHFGRVATAAAVTAALQQLAHRCAGDRAYLLPPRHSRVPASLPPGALDRVVTLRRAAIWTETSHRAQRRSNIDVTSLMLVPVVDDDEVAAVVVVERSDPRPFPAEALALGTSGVETLAPLLRAWGDEQDSAGAAPAPAEG